MKVNKRILLIASISILLVICITVILNGVNNMRPEKALSNFVEQIEKGSIGDITLTIYQRPTVFTPLAVNFSVKELINYSQTKKVVIDGTRLAEHLDLLKTIGNVDLKPVKTNSRINAQIHYVFENKGHKVFEVTLDGYDEENDIEFLLVNGFKIKINDIFYSIIEPFMPYPYTR